jgi:DNA-binding CsgD family transcriptional regulator/ligand-binding sensor protein
MEYRLPDLVNVAKLQTIADLWYKVTGISLAIIDPEGSTHAKSGHLDICYHFCQLDQKAKERCGRSDARYSAKVMASREYRVETCRNGLVDASMPIMVLGEHMGNFVTGPLFFQQPDKGFFKQNAMASGSDEHQHINTMSKIPVLAEAKLHSLLQGFSSIAETLCEAGLGKLTKAGTRVSSGQNEEDRSEIKKNIVSNVEGTILPYIKKLKRSGLSAEQMRTVDIIESNLKEITSPIIGKMQALGLTARESAVASLLKDGKTSKEIAELLGVSLKAVEFHRYNIRKKLALDHTKTNLKDHLLSIT